MRLDFFYKIFALFTLFACSVHDVKTDYSQELKKQQSFSAQGSRSTKERWWLEFGDKELEKHVESALKQNLDLKAMSYKVSQLQLLSKKYRAYLWPQVETGASLNRTKTYVDEPAPSPFPGINTGSRSETKYGLNASVSYELDVFGKLQGILSAADNDFLSGRESLKALYQSIAALVAETYYTRSEAILRLGLLKRQIKTNEEFLSILVGRFNEGQSNALQVNQQRQLLSSQKALIPSLEANVEILNRKLLLLSAEFSNSLKDSDFIVSNLPDIGELPISGLPFDVLKKRADVNSARLALIAADHRLASAIADRFPSFRIFASISDTDKSVSDLFKDWIFSLGTSIGFTIFDGGRKRLEADRRRMMVKEKLLQFQNTVLKALAEVEDALIKEDRQWATKRAQEEYLKISAETLELAKVRYFNGEADFLSVLNATQAYQQAELRVLNENKKLISIRISLYKSLGSSWTEKELGKLSVKNPSGKEK